jgi:hypothetical protein
MIVLTHTYHLLFLHSQEYFNSVYQYCYERSYRLAWDLNVPVRQLQNAARARPLTLARTLFRAASTPAFCCTARCLALPLWLLELLVGLDNWGMKGTAFVVAAK